MIITTDNLKRIAERLGSILSKNINIMDETGTIVASTDENRIGTFHQAAKDLIDRNISEIDVYSNDSFIGSKAGINLPLSIEGKTIGVIGVTGNPEELRDIGLVIAEMAKIMIHEATNYSYFGNLEKMRQRFWEELLFGNPELLDPAFLARGQDLQIDVAKIRGVSVVAAPSAAEVSIRSAAYGRLQQLVAQSPLSNRTVSHTLLLGEKVVFFLTREPTKVIQEHFQKILDCIRTEMGISLHCGLCGGCSSYSEIGKAHTYAEQALGVARSLDRPNVCLYDKLILEVLLSQLSHEEKNAYVRKVWRELDERSIQKPLEILDVYFENNCSITATAEKLYIHKNTVQYKLKKIAEQTGFDPRDLKDAVVLYLCVRIRQLG